MNECSLPVTGVGTLPTAVAAVVVILLGCAACWISRRPRVPLVAIAVIAASLGLVGFGTAANAASPCLNTSAGGPSDPPPTKPPAATPTHPSTTVPTPSADPSTTTSTTTPPGPTTSTTAPTTAPPTTDSPTTSTPTSAPTTEPPTTEPPNSEPPATSTTSPSSSSTSTSTTTPENSTTTSTTTTIADTTTTTIPDTTTSTTTTTLPNQAPAANDDFYSMLRTTASFGGNILVNDSDPDPGDAIDGITSLSGSITAWGTFTLTNWVTGDFIYTLDTENATIRNLGPGSSLDHQITYRITDGESSDTATITIRIFGTGDDPV
jgi:VCBS repeat-containing protein